MDYKTGVAADGRILARKVRLLLDGGAYCSWSETTLGKACILSAGPYRIDNLHAEAVAVYRQALELDPGYAVAHVNLSHALLQMVVISVYCCLNLN